MPIATARPDSATMAVPVVLLLLLAVSPGLCQDDLYTVGSVFRNSIGCPDTCVFSHLTQYCDAYLTTRDLCVPGMVCCVSRDKYGGRPSPDLVIPNEKKLSTKKPTTALITTTPRPQRGQKCRGDCIRGLFSLLCDNIDEEAFCPDEGSCCTTEQKSETTTTPRPTTTMQPPPLPRCRGFCIHVIMAAFCKPPAVKLHNTQCKLSNSFCCDNSNVSTTPPTAPRAG